MGRMVLGRKPSRGGLGRIGGMSGNGNGHLPDGYWVEGSMLFSEERVMEPLSKESIYRPKDLGPRPICSWNGSGCPSPDLLVRVARLDLASRHGSPPVRRQAGRELADLFRRP